jgi:hypothetical protein
MAGGGAALFAMSGEGLRPSTRGRHRMHCGGLRLSRARFNDARANPFEEFRAARVFP